MRVIRTLGATSISLPKNQPKTLSVSINPSAQGVHSAVLNLDDPSTPGIEYQTLNTVVVPYTFDEDSGYAQTVTGMVGLMRRIVLTPAPAMTRSCGAVGG